ESPTSGFFALSLYNFLFYQTYARVLSPFGLPAAWLPVAARLLTIAFAACGAVVQHVLVAGILKRRRVRVNPIVLAAFSFCTWFGPGFIGPWAVSARPDVAACAFALAAFAACVTVVDGQPAARLLIAGILFYVAGRSSSPRSRRSAACVCTSSWCAD